MNQPYWTGLRAGFQFTTLAVRRLGERLGSSSVIVNADGTQVSGSPQGYYPWGETRFGSLETEYQYTGQYRLAALGLDYFNARWYDSSLGRWTQPDTDVPESQDGRGLDRFAYVANNPVVYQDPSGHCWGVASGIRGVPSYDTTCNNLDMALTIVQHPEASFAQKAGAGAYIAGEAVAHGALVAGLAGLGCAAIGTACTTVVEGALGIGAGASADGNPTNEAELVRQAIQNGSNLVKNGSGQGYNSFSAFKNAQNPAGGGMAWHHIVEQNPLNISKFGSQAINNTSNLIRLPSGAGLLHQRISGFYSSIQPLITGSDTLTVRQWLQTKSFEFQWQFGIEIIEKFGGDDYIIDQFGEIIK